MYIWHFLRYAIFVMITEAAPPLQTLIVESVLTSGTNVWQICLRMCFELALKIALRAPFCNICLHKGCKHWTSKLSIFRRRRNSEANRYSTITIAFQIIAMFLIMFLFFLVLCGLVLNNVCRLVAATWDIHQPDSLASMSGKSSLTWRNTADNVKVIKIEQDRNSHFCRTEPWSR